MADGNRLARARSYLGLSPGEVAAFLGVTERELGAWEGGAPVPPAPLKRLSALYRRTPGYLEGGEAPPPVPEAVRALASSGKLRPADRAELEEFGRFLAGAPGA